MHSRHWTILAILLIANIAAAGSLYGIYQFIASKNRDISTQEQTAQLKEEQNDRHFALRRSLRETEALRAELDPYYLNSDKTVTLIERVEALGEHAGAPVTFDSVNTNGGLVMDFSSSGSFSANAYLLTLLEHLPMKHHVTRAQIVQNEDETAWNGTFTMVVESYNDK